MCLHAYVRQCFITLHSNWEQSIQRPGATLGKPVSRASKIVRKPLESRGIRQNHEIPAPDRDVLVAALLSEVTKDRGAVRRAG